MHVKKVIDLQGDLAGTEGIGGFVRWVQQESTILEIRDSQHHLKRPQHKAQTLHLLAFCPKSTIFF